MRGPPFHPLLAYGIIVLISALGLWLVLRKRRSSTVLVGSVALLTSVAIVMTALVWSQYSKPPHPYALWIRALYDPVREHWVMGAPYLPLPTQTILSGRTSEAHALYWTLATKEEAVEHYRELSTKGTFRLEPGDEPGHTTLLFTYQDHPYKVILYHLPDHPRILRMGVDGTLPAPPSVSALRFWSSRPGVKSPQPCRTYVKRLYFIERKGFQT